MVLCNPADAAKLRVHSLDSDRHFLVVELGDRFVEVLSLVFAAREDLYDGGRREA